MSLDDEDWPGGMSQHFDVTPFWWEEIDLVVHPLHLDALVAQAAIDHMEKGEWKSWNKRKCHSSYICILFVLYVVFLVVIKWRCPKNSFLNFFPNSQTHLPTHGFTFRTQTKITHAFHHLFGLVWFGLEGCKSNTVSMYVDQHGWYRAAKNLKITQTAI